MTGGPVVVDLRVLQAPDSTGAGDARYAYEFAIALERYRPDLVGRYLLSPDLPTPSGLGELLASGKLADTETMGAIPEGARVYHTLSTLDPAAPTSALWPSVVEHLGLSYTASVRHVIRTGSAEEPSHERRHWQRYGARNIVLRLADALLVPSEAAERELVGVGVERSAINVVGSGEPWRDVVDRAAGAFERLAARQRRPWRTGLRVALVSPFPPIASGVARYSAQLAEALAAELATIVPPATLDCFVDGLDRLPVSAARLSPRVVTSPDVTASPPEEGGWFDARHFSRIEGAMGGYERVIYVLGNSEFHSAALVALRRRNGTVMAHDVRVTDLLRLSSRVRGAVPGGLEGAIRRAYGDTVPEGLGRNDRVSEAELEQFGLLLLRDIAPHADQLLVTSEAARRLAETDVGPQRSGRLGVLPFAMALEDSELEAVASARRFGPGNDRPVVASFGIVDPVKLPHLLLDAVAAVRKQVDADIAFVGPVSDALAGELRARADELGFGERLRVTGHVDRSVYLRFLGWAAVAVQLRADFAGEASAAVGDCLAAGIPTIVSDIGWMADLPDDTVVKLSSPLTPSTTTELADDLLSLLEHSDRRARLAGRAAGFAATSTFGRTAAALVAALGLPAD